MGKLNYLTVTRLDIAFDVSIVSQFLSTPKMITHWDAVVWILRYMKSHGKGLLYSNNFSDVDWTGSPLIGDLLHAFAFFLEKILCHGKARSRM